MNLAVIAGTQRGTRMGGWLDSVAMGGTRSGTWRGGLVKFGCDWGHVARHMEEWVG